jgi:hypothetical protein
MVDSSELSAKKVKKKRTLSSHEEKRQKPSKINRIDHDSAKEKDSKQETEEVASPWRNLQLILSIQNREIHLQKLDPFSLSLSLSLSVIVLSLLNFRVSRNYLGFCLDC